MFESSRSFEQAISYSVPQADIYLGRDDRRKYSYAAGFEMDHQVVTHSRKIQYIYMAAVP